MKHSTHDFSTEVLEAPHVSTLKKNQFIKGKSPLQNLLLSMINKGGPEAEDYANLDRFMEVLYLSVQVGLISDEEIEEAKKLFTEEFLTETIHGYGYRKPLGYAGDYLMIDKIYTHHHTTHPFYEKWDKYFHHNAATEAVRNRKSYFKKQMTQKLKESEGPLKLLNVASGPARDLMELYQKINPSRLKATCVDLDEKAIAYAKGTCRQYLQQIEFHHKNVLRFNTEEQFDVIWSAGLFDYFEDKVFVLAIKRFLKWLKPGGEIIIGNFSEDNSSRGYMELFGEWYLLHRSKRELIELAMQAGVKGENIRIDQEPLGVNLFLRIQG